MRKRLTVTLAALLLSLCLTAVYAATWTKIGTSGLTTTPALMQDYNKVILNSIAIDSAGNIYITANNGGNRGMSGGVTIFNPNGAKLRDIDVNAKGFPGGITKLVTAGDGRVYGLQNWREAWAWGYPDAQCYNTEGIPEKILRFNLDGSVDMIYESLPVGDGWFTDVSPGPQTVIDIPGEPGNKGIEVVDGSDTEWSQWYRKTLDAECTLAARFYVSDYATDTARPTYLMQLNAGNCVTTPAVAIAIRPDGHFWLTYLNGDDAEGAGNIQDLGPITIGAMNEAYLYVNGPASQARLRFNGTDYTVNVTDATKLWGGSTGWPQLGAGTDWGFGGTSTIVYDWIAYGRGYLTSANADWVALADGTILPPRTQQSLNGLTVADDGNLYFTRATMGPDRGKWLWRYNVTTGGPPELCPVGGGYNTVDIFNDIEYTRDGYFAIFQGIESGRFLDPMRWDQVRVQARNVGSGAWDPGWGRQNRTAAAYDPLRNVFWSGYRPNNMPANGRVSQQKENQANTGILVDIDSGNKGIQQKKLANEATTPADSTANCWRVIYNDSGGARVEEFTAAGRFRVDEFDGALGTRFVINAPSNYPKTNPADTRGYAPWIWIGVDEVNGELRWQLGLDPDGVDPESIVKADLGPFVAGTFNEFYLYSERSLPGVPRRAIAWWNGSKVYDETDVPDAECANGFNDDSYVEFGASLTSVFNGGFRPGTATVTFDWLSMGRGLIQPSDAAKKWDYSFTGAHLPTAISPLKTNFVTQYRGNYDSTTSVWDVIDPEAWIARIPSVTHVHANGNNPAFLDQKRVAGWYWVNTMTVNPADGKCWMSWGAEAAYDYGDVGRVLTRDIAWNLGDEGVPEPGAQVVGLKYQDARMYALVCNMTTGAYSLYRSNELPTYSAASVATIKNAPVGAMVSTDYTVVTYPADRWQSFDQSFYIEDENRAGGIKVIPADPDDLKTKDTKVSVSGILDVVNGELVINHATVSENGAGEIKPLAMNIKSVGGGKLGGQPATIPAVQGLSNIGLLVRVSGKIVYDIYAVDYWYYIDDGSGNVIYIDWDLGMPYGGFGSVTGVLAVNPVDTSNPPDGKPDELRRILLLRDESDIDIAN